MNNHCLEHLARLHPEATPLNHTLAVFTPAKVPTADNFREGVRRFIDMVNMPPAEREHVYGSRFAGLYTSRQ